MDSFDSMNSARISYMIYGVCTALGGADMTSTHRDGLLQQVLDLYETRIEPPVIRQLMSALCKGVSDRIFTGMNMFLCKEVMDRPFRDAVLAQLLRRHEIWSLVELGESIFILCVTLGGITMSAEHRDTVVTWILARSATGSALKMGAMSDLLQVSRWTI